MESHTCAWLPRCLGGAIVADELLVEFRSKLTWSRVQDLALGELKVREQVPFATIMTDGDAAGILQVSYVDFVTVPANGIASIDLTSNTQSFLHANIPAEMNTVHFFRAVNTSATSSIYLLADASSPFNNYACKIGPGGEFVATNEEGWAVTADNNPFNIANSGSSDAVCELYIFGA